MVDITREEIDAKIETKFVGLAGQIEMLTAEMRSEFRHQREDTALLRAEMQGMKTTILVTVVGSVLAVLGIMLAGQSNLLSAFQAGIAASAIHAPPSKL